MLFLNPLQNQDGDFHTAKYLPSAGVPFTQSVMAAHYGNKEIHAVGRVVVLAALPMVPMWSSPQTASILAGLFMGDPRRCGHPVGPHGGGRAAPVVLINSLLHPRSLCFSTSVRWQVLLFRQSSCLKKRLLHIPWQFRLIPKPRGCDTLHERLQPEPVAPGDF